MPENNQKNNNDKHNSLPSEKEDILFLSKAEYDELKAKAQKAEESLDKHLRAQAEFENIKKRLQRERQDIIMFATEDLIVDLLTVLDDLERSVALTQQNKNDMEVFLKGIELILGHFYDILKKRGLTPIDAEGKIFDPHFHEAFLHIENNELADHTVVEELQKGYLLNGRVIRTAKVKISKKTV